MLDQYITVSELNIYIKTYLENNYFLQDLYVKGEISNFKRHQSGTLYFSIKDEKSAINVVMFANYANKLKVNIKDGDLVLIKGRISVYEVRGTYSINATEIIFDSKGMLLIAFEQLKEKLFNEGLFDEKYKKELPKYPNSIGLITAYNGAAIQDMLKTIRRRWPIAKVYVYPCLVQGSSAANDIVKNIKLADKDNLDVIICGRGGGSIEDLWPFNEEIVARAIFNCNTPIISAVGHEIDFTISDYVADARGLTPTDGAVKATSDYKEVLVKINEYKNQLIINFDNYLKFLKTNINNLKNSYVLTNPLKIYENYHFMIDDLQSSLLSNMSKSLHDNKIKLINLKSKLNNESLKYVNNNKSNLMSLCGKLDGLSPLKVLNRGYVYATSDNKVIKSVDDIKINNTIDLSFKDGNVKALVTKKEKK